MVKVRLLICADDMTGALDTAVQLTAQGIPAFVTCNLTPDIEALPNEIQVLVVNTESRHLGAGEAAERVSIATRHAKNAGVELFYKKTDSVLRGNLGSEFGAMMEAAGKERLFFVPAYPAMQRYTIGGEQYVGKLQLSSAIESNDTLNPLSTSNVKELIGRQTERAVHHVETGQTIERGLNGIFAFDAETDADLAHIAGMLADMEQYPLTAGCAGFAIHLPMFGELQRHKFAPLPRAKKALVINGSVNHTSRRQIDYVAQKRVGRVFTMTHEQTENADYWATASAKKWADETNKQAKDMPLVIRSIQSDAAVPTGSIFSREYLCHEETLERSRRITANIAKMAKMLIEAGKYDTLIVFGGDTLNAILAEMDCAGVFPERELLPGIPRSVAKVGEKNLTIISKSGGFGKETTLYDLLGLI